MLATVRFVEIAKNVTYSGFSDDVVGRIDGLLISVFCSLPPELTQPYKVTQEYTGNELNTEVYNNPSNE